MERFSQRESVLLGYSPQRSFMNDTSCPRSPYVNSDIDFKDVFGGPPRRSSIHETRYSYIEATDNSALIRHDEAVASRNSWNGLSEKPVFGEEGLTRRRYPSENFFDDIFRGNESLSSSPRKREWDPYSSSPGSRVLSPAWPLPAKAEAFGSSLPAQFSLPAKLTKWIEHPTFDPAHRGTYKSKDGASNGMNYYSSPLSRSSSLKKGHEDKDDSLSGRQSLLSRELSLSSKEPSNLTKYDETESGGYSKKDLNSSEVPNDCSQFHFSIYKWASKGVPLAMPLRGEKVSRLKENGNKDRCSGPNGWIASEGMAKELPTETLHDAEFLSNYRISANTKSFTMERDTENNGSPPVATTQDRVEPSQRVCLDDNNSQSTGEETKFHSHSEIGLSDKLEKKISAVAEAHKPELKPLCSLFYGADYEQSKEEKTKKASGKESTVKITKKSSVVDFSKNIKKQDGNRTTLYGVEVGKASLQSSTMHSGDPDKIRVKGKVKEFVAIFNQEALPKVKTIVEPQNQSCRWKEIDTSKAENFGTDEIFQIPKSSNGHERKSIPDASMVDEYIEHSKKQDASVKNSNHVSHGPSIQKDSSTSMPNGSKVVVGDLDDSFQENFQVKELTQDENKLPQACSDPEDIQIIDAKIRQWSNGKEGNIRSLLSTLQYVLWPESGWKPVPLVDIIEGNAVKRSYQKALLHLHPDKLQQKGAASHQKYIAEKVFDILQDAWTHFNSLGSL